MWLLGRLQPDYKSIAEFRRMHWWLLMTKLGCQVGGFRAPGRTGAG